MHTRVLAVAAVATLGWHTTDSIAAPACTLMARYPSPIGHQTILLATATTETVTAPVDSQYAYGRRTAVAQKMTIADVAGSQSGLVRRGLRDSNNTAVFVRYVVGQGCSPYPAYDGGLDSVGVSALYIAHVRTRDRWVDDTPTFDVFLSQFYPLPQRLSGLGRRLPNGARDMTPTMDARELFTMYRAFWAESVYVDDPSVERRIRQWIKANPAAARKQPVEDVASIMALAVVDARIAANTIPFGGTFAITVTVPGIDSLVMYGQTSIRARPWIVDLVRETSTGVPVAAIARSFAIDVTTASALQGFQRATWQTNPCPPIPIIVDALPIIAHGDSAWRARVHPSGFLQCAPAGSTLQSVTLPGATRSFFPGETDVTFRRYADGRITFEALGIREGYAGILTRGVRVSTAEYGAPFD
jgi:hypothetical protein